MQRDGFPWRVEVSSVCVCVYVCGGGGGSVVPSPCSLGSEMGVSRNRGEGAGGKGVESKNRGCVVKVGVSGNRGAVAGQASSVQEAEGQCQVSLGWGTTILG